MGSVQRRLTIALLVVAAALSACEGEPAEPRATDPELTAGAVQYREDHVTGMMRILLGNNSPDTVVVQDLRLSWPGLEEVDSVRLDYALRPGATAALVIPFGSAVCDTSEPATDNALAVMTLAGLGDVRVPITDGLQTLTRLHDRDCTRRELERRVNLGFAPASTWLLLDIGGKPVLRGGLIVTRRAYEADVVLDGAQGSVVLTPSMTPPATSPWLTLPSGMETAEVSVDITSSGRCGGHVLGEVKKPYEFEFFVDVGAGLQAYAVDSEEDLQLRLRDEVFFPGCGVTPTTSAG
ncbi:MAG: hypothetical protein ABWZ26_03095 [Candidatus Nanopelagicales bacterium]